MGLIKGNGAPIKTTKGAVGDTYIDLDTGKNYICVSVFHISWGESEYDWQYSYITDVTVQKPEETPETVDTVVSQEQKPIEYASQNREWSSDNNRKPYNKQYNKHYNQNRN